MIGDSITLDRTTLQIVFDVAVGSIDFGSGFLVDEDVEAMRALAVAIGVDPMTATPRNFQCKYTGQHIPWGKGHGLQCGSGIPYERLCQRCGAFLPEVSP
jgi:hypothetical protein